MNGPDVDDLMIMLISAGWTNREILDVLKKVSSIQPSQLQQGLNELAWRFEDATKFKIFSRGSSYVRSGLVKRSVSYDNESELYQKVRDMLVVDVGLSAERIVELLSERLAGDDYIPPLSKKSLSNWLERLSHYFPPSEILHAASVIRDQYIKNSGLDWRVRGES